MTKKDFLMFGLGWLSAAIGMVIGAVTDASIVGRRVPQATTVITTVESARYKIAIVDTGFDPARAHGTIKLCKTGHFDAHTNTANINYVHAHGTKVASVLAEKLKDVDYCFVIFQVYENGSDQIKPLILAKAFDDSIGLGVTAVNLSLSGEEQSPSERAAILNLNKVHIPIFVAAGNNRQNLDVKCNIYPTCYGIETVIPVGARDPENPKVHSRYSNYGKAVKEWALGHYRMGDEDKWMDGTSFAAPRALAEYILFLEHKRLQGAEKHK